jgi:hypothetical protein
MQGAKTSNTHVEILEILQMVRGGSSRMTSSSCDQVKVVDGSTAPVFPVRLLARDRAVENPFALSTSLERPQFPFCFASSAHGTPHLLHLGLPLLWNVHAVLQASSPRETALTRSLPAVGCHVHRCNANARQVNLPGVGTRSALRISMSEIRCLIYLTRMDPTTFRRPLHKQWGAGLRWVQLSAVA